MNIRVLALSTALLFTTGAFAQNKGAATPPATQNSMSSSQNGTANNGNRTNNGTVQPAPPAPLNSTPATKPMAYNCNQGGNGGGWSWGWIGLFGLFGLLGMGGGRRRNRDVVATNVPR